MNVDRLLQLYEKVADTPEAVPRLRQFVLDLAVRGKLVAQDLIDEPASELLKRIATERVRLTKAGEIKKQKLLPKIEEDEVPFGLPHGWAWARLGTLIDLISGQHLQPPEYSENSAAGVPYITGPSDFGREGLVIRRYALVRKAVATRGQLLLTVKGSGVGKTTLCDLEEVAISRQLMALTAICWDPAFLELVADRLAKKLQEEARSLIPGISREDVTGFVVALPPLAEQQRIVSKVEELMALLDRLEAARLKRESTRDRLAIASLARLTGPAATAEDLAASARFALNALPALTTRTDQIKQLRQTILNLAVRGKLVEQDPADEPAYELLKRIAAEKERLRAEKGIRAQKTAPPVETFEAEAEIPPTWQHAYLQEIAYQITDGTHLTPKYTDRGRPFLSAQNVKPFRFMPEIHRFVSKEDFEKYRSNRRPERGDVLLTRVGAGIGEAAVLDSDFEFAFYVSLCLIKVPNDLVNVDYLVIWLNSPEGRESSTVRTYGKGASQGNLNLGLIRTFKIPFPPLAEQHRIVAKVDALMALFDRLEAALTTVDATRARLLEALLNEALTPATKSQREAAE